MPLSPERMAELDQYYANQPDYLTQLAPEQPKPTGLTPERIAQLDQFYANKNQPNMLEDVAKSSIYRGLPEGLAASTIGGMGLNVTHALADATRWAGGQAYKAIEGEELPNYTENPIPTSSDVVKSVANNLIGTDLYEPKTVPGQYANTLTQFAGGAKATGIPLASAIPAAVVSETAGQATKGTPYEGPARIAGALLTPAAIAGGRGALNSLKITPKTTSAEVRAASTQAFADADAAGGILKPHITDAWVGNASSILPQTPAGRAIFNQKSPSAEIINNLQSGIKGKPLTLAEAQEIDSKLGDMISGEVDSLTGKLSTEGNNLLHIQRTLRDTIETAGPSDIAGGKAGFDALNKGRQLWAAQARMGDIERIITKSQGADNPSTVLKNGFRALANNPSRMRGFTAQEKSAILHASKTGLLTGGLKTLGSRLMSGIAGTVAGAAGAGPIGAAAGLVAGEAAGAPLRAAANSLQKGRANSVLDRIAARPIVQTAMPQLQSSPNLLTSMMPQNAVPTSILASLLAQQRTP